MAKRTKRTTTRKLKARGRVQKRGKPAKQQAGKRLVKAKPKQKVTKAKQKRSVAKKSASRRPTTPAEPNNLETETTIIDVIEEPVPGVLVVTELEETHTRRPDTTQLDQDQTPASPSGKDNPE